MVVRAKIVSSKVPYARFKSLLLGLQNDVFS
jgi:hypothetical protein